MMIKRIFECNSCANRISFEEYSALPLRRCPKCFDGAFDELRVEIDNDKAEMIKCKECNLPNLWWRNSCTDCGGELDLDALKKPRLIKCSNCEKEISERAEICPQCKTPLKNTCSICKALIPTGSECCPECGDISPFEPTDDAEALFSCLNCEARVIFRVFQWPFLRVAVMDSIISLFRLSE